LKRKEVLTGCSHFLCVIFLSTIIAGNYNVAHGRPIHPLPKRRLRSRLSENESLAIFAPLSQPNPQPLFYLPYTYPPPDSVSTGTSAIRNGNTPTSELLHDSSDEEESHVSSGRYGADGSLEDPASGFGPGSANDGYDWSENTNNKKKRKIPTPAHPGGVSGSSYTGSTGSQTGYSPNGSTSTPRNRWKTANTQRSPLSNLSSGSNGSSRRVRRYPNGTTSPSFPETPTKKPSARDLDDTLPTTPTAPEHENRTDASGMIAPASQFTFICDSPISANLAYSHTPRELQNLNTLYTKSMSTKGTQTSPSMSNSGAYPPASGMKKKSNPARSAARREFNLQQQRLQQRQTALTNNARGGEIWICEFCEYESIFGHPPEALMRQYDIKDRKERRRQAEKRRLLEKAKQKNKKHNNNGRNGSGKKSQQQQQQQHQQTQGQSQGQQQLHFSNMSNSTNPPPPPPPPSERDSQGTHSDNTPLASAAPTPALRPQRHRTEHQPQGDEFPDDGRYRRRPDDAPDTVDVS